MKHHYLLGLFAICILAFGCRPNPSQEGKNYTNPLKTEEGNPLYIADPYVYQHDTVNYLTGTTTLPKGEGFACYTSTDLITWKYHGLLFQRPENHIGTWAYWAPEVEYYNGKFYMTYSCFVKGKDRL